MSSIQDTIKQQISVIMILYQHLKLNLFRRKLMKHRVYKITPVYPLGRTNAEGEKYCLQFSFYKFSMRIFFIVFQAKIKKLQISGINKFCEIFFFKKVRKYCFHNLQQISEAINMQIKLVNEKGLKAAAYRYLGDY